MEGSSRNGNMRIQNEECEMFLNAIKCENEIMKKQKENPSLKTRKNRVSKTMKKINKIWNYYISKGKSANFVIGMLYVGHFSM